MVSVIILQGMLHGKGREVECEVLAWKGSPDSKYAYSQMRVVRAPDNLSDGEYALEIDGTTVPTKKEHGSWTMVEFGHSA